MSMTLGYAIEQVHHKHLRGSRYVSAAAFVQAVHATMRCWLSSPEESTILGVVHGAYELDGGRLNERLEAYWEEHACPTEPEKDPCANIGCPRPSDRTMRITGVAATVHIPVCEECLSAHHDNLRCVFVVEQYRLEERARGDSQ